MKMKLIWSLSGLDGEGRVERTSGTPSGSATDIWSEPPTTSILSVYEQRGHSAESPEPSLHAYAIGTDISCAGAYTDRSSSDQLVLL